MTRSRNADDFREALRRIEREYEERYRPTIERIRQQVQETSETVPASVDEALEAHLRLFKVNKILAALNWGLGMGYGDPLNMINEAPLTSVSRDTRRFLDYLGFDCAETLRPLIVVETKRPKSKLPEKKKRQTYEDFFALGIAQSDLRGEWGKWIKDLQDYVISVKEKLNCVPARAVITNGDWLIIFEDPDNAFCSDSLPDPALIRVFTEFEALDDQANEIFNLLNYSALIEQKSPLQIIEICFHMDPKSIDKIAHGLFLTYSETAGIHEPPSPLIKVVPVVLLGSKDGKWITAEMRGPDYPLPDEEKKIPGHIAKVTNEADGLLREARKHIKNLTILSIVDFYDQVVDPGCQLGVVERECNTYSIVTGQAKHYFRKTPTVIDCQYHDWARASAAHRACNMVPIMSRQTNPRSFFFSGELHYCAHADVEMLKSSPLTPTNREFCGPRSNKDGEAFCEISKFEKYLCCRTCAFDEVCTRAPVFQLPCNPA